MVGGVPSVLAEHQLVATTGRRGDRRDTPSTQHDETGHDKQA